MSTKNKPVRNYAFPPSFFNMLLHVMSHNMQHSTVSKSRQRLLLGMIKRNVCYFPAVLIYKTPLSICDKRFDSKPSRKSVLVLGHIQWRKLGGVRGRWPIILDLPKCDAQFISSSSQECIQKKVQITVLV